MTPDTTILTSLAIALGVFAMVGVPDAPSASGSAQPAAGVYVSAPAAGEAATVPLPPAERVGTVHQVADTLPEPTTTTVPVPVPTAGDCDTWRPVLEHHGASPAAVEFFVDGGILHRETRCGLDTLNEDTNDSGICQINPIHNQAGWFGGREFGDGGWLTALHGLRTGRNTDDPAWAAACVTLFNVCGTGPWRPPYSCANNRLD